MQIRQVVPGDAAQLLHLRLTLDSETEFMLYEPGERQVTVEQERSRIAHLLDDECGMIFVAEQERQMVGYLSINRGTLRRIEHKGYIVIGILQAFTGQGIGTRLFVAMEEWAHQQGLHRLELSVMAHNQAGLALYKKQGFEIEGRMKHALYVNSRYVDEFHMAKLLEASR